MHQSEEHKLKKARCRRKSAKKQQQHEWYQQQPQQFNNNLNSSTTTSAAQQQTAYKKPRTLALAATTSFQNRIAGGKGVSCPIKPCLTIQLLFVDPIRLSEPAEKGEALPEDAAKKKNPKASLTIQGNNTK
ncbi:unnamed protein product [Ceratitis capitata]|uniref:(Mediterranean fruit fly) hypothetical protein n=1 Tax=Ceratitis capitata TaxID=7213 RepID=A0A811V0E8_CERCA|nr:unnamed protein product [Ceratitis capitata]